MAKVQIGPRLEEELYNKLLDKVGGKEHVNKTVIELIEAFVNGETSPLQESVTQPEAPKKKLVSGLPNLADLPDHLKKPEEFEYYLDYVDYLEKEGYLDCF